MSRLRAVALLSAVYDCGLGIGLLVAPGLLPALLGGPPPAPPVLAQAAGLLLLGIGLGYLAARRDPDGWRAYLWIMGPLLKGGGAALFVADHLLRRSPGGYLLFALSDGGLALLTWLALRESRPGSS